MGWHSIVAHLYPRGPFQSSRRRLTSDSKRITPDRQIGLASFIAPYRNHHGHKISPIGYRRLTCGRGDSDTVLGNIGSQCEHYLGGGAHIKSAGNWPLPSLTETELADDKS
jgi:hypothetical protein